MALLQLLASINRPYEEVGVSNDMHEDEEEKDEEEVKKSNLSDSVVQSKINSQVICSLMQRKRRKGVPQRSPFF